jgi:hypothetical protein
MLFVGQFFGHLELDFPPSVISVLILTRFRLLCINKIF